MKTLNDFTSACRYCRYYNPEGRRGGMCQQLGVPVRGTWKACSLALPPFAPSWETLEGMMILSDKNLKIQETIASNCALGYTEPKIAEEKIPSTPTKLAALV